MDQGRKAGKYESISNEKVDNESTMAAKTVYCAFYYRLINANERSIYSLFREPFAKLLPYIDEGQKPHVEELF